MPDFGGAFVVLLYTIVVLFVLAVLLAAYVIWQALFGYSDWEVCSQLATAVAKVQCMETF